MIFGIKTTSDISKLSQISLAKRLVKFRQYNNFEISLMVLILCQMSPQIMLLPILILKGFERLSTTFKTCFSKHP